MTGEGVNDEDGNVVDVKKKDAEVSLVCAAVVGGKKDGVLKLTGVANISSNEAEGDEAENVKVTLGEKKNVVSSVGNSVDVVSEGRKLVRVVVPGRAIEVLVAYKLLAG